MKIHKTILDGCLIIEPKIFYDNRGFFLESYQLEKYKQEAGINEHFVQDNYSRSSRDVLRGLHFQKLKPQGKLVRVVKGKVFDVAVDIRKKSPSYGKWVSVVLSESNMKQLWIPPGFAHGFFVLSKFADFEYKCSDYYDPSDEGCILWNDPDLSISWPTENPILSDKDAKAQRLIELKK